MNNKKVESIIYDWFYSTDIGEQYTVVTVDKNEVKNIEYHIPIREGDKHYCDVFLNDGSIFRKFNLNSVNFK